MAIPTCLVEEHHEAYFCWHYFIDKKFIERENNYLLHIDHHDDLAHSNYNCDFDNMPQNYEEAKAFAYKVLGVGDFIIPAVYQKIFSVMHIFMNLVPKEYKDMETVIKPKGKELMLSDVIPLVHSKYKNDPDSKYVFFTARNGSLCPIQIDQPLVLDVDLDYFCWDNSCETGVKNEIEVTKEAYEEFSNNCYHEMRLTAKRIINIEERGGRYYLKLALHANRDTLPSEEKIITRMDKLFTWFAENKIEPKAIDICRSAKSGYLPKEEAQFVEDEFMKRLNEMYNIELHSVL